MIADIVYDRSYAPTDGILSNHELLHPVKVIRIRPRDLNAATESLSNRIVF